MVINVVFIFLRFLNCEFWKTMDFLPYFWNYDLILLLFILGENRFGEG